MHTLFVAPRRESKSVWRRLKKAVASVAVGALVAVGLTVGANVGGFSQDAAFADDPAGCNYAPSGTGAYVQTICWIDWSSYNRTAATSAAGQPMSVYLGSGLTADFTLRTAGQIVAGAPVPTYDAAYFGQDGTTYSGLTGPKALYQVGVSSNTSTITMSDVVIRNAAGVALTGYRLVVADAEDTSTGGGTVESFRITSDMPLNRLEPLGNACSGGVTGDGTTNLLCSGGSLAAKTGAMTAGARDATTVTAQLNTVSGRQAASLGIMVSKITLNKSVAGRYNSTDEFSVQVVDTAGTSLGTGATAGTTAATTTPVTVLGGSFTLSETATSGNLGNYTQAWACTNRGTAFDASGTLTTATVDSGDVVVCTITNTPFTKPVDASGTAAQGAPVTLAPALPGNVDPSTVVLLDGDGNPVKTLAVAGEGTWTVNADGSVTFVPEAGFQGDPAPVPYTANDAGGQLITPSATLTVTYPDVADSTVIGAEGQPTVVSPDLTGLDPASVVIYDADGNPVKSRVVPGEGTWTVNPDGTISFAPDPGFTGTATPITYAAADPAGNFAQPATATVSFAGIGEATTTATAGQPAVVTPDLDAGLDPATLTLVDADGNRVSTLTVDGEGTWAVQPDGTITFTPDPGFVGDATPVPYTAAAADGNFATPASASVTYVGPTDTTASGAQGQPTTITPSLEPGFDPATTVLLDQDGNPTKNLDVPGEGTWVVNPDGTITFTPAPGFQGDPTPAPFTAQDATGTLAAPATLTLNYPDVSNGTASGAQGSEVTFTGLIDEDVDPASVSLLDSDGNPVKNLSVPGEGAWAVNPDGTVTFTPAPGFQGDPTPVQVTATDASGNPALPAELTVAYPDVADVSGVGAEGQPTTVAPPLRNIDPTTVALLDAGGNPVPSLTVAGEGTWTANADGTITFAPTAGFTGNPAPVQFTGTDAQGNAAEPATATVTYAGVSDATAVGAAGQPVTVDTVLEAGLDPATVQLVAADGTRTSQLVVPGEGTWTVNADGTITFTPDAGFTGDPAPVSYTAANAEGVFADPATVTVTYASVSDTSAIGAEGQPVTAPAVLEPGLDPTTVQLVDAAGNRVSSITVPGEGTWSVSPISGALTFTPDAGFTGDPAPVQYTAANAAGDFADPATATVTYAGVSPVTPVAAEGQPVTVAPILEAGLDPASVVLLDPAGNPVKSVDVPGEGSWVVDPVTGEITFTPVAGFTGDPTPVSYTAAAPDGTLANPAPITINYAGVSPVTPIAAEGQPASFAPALDTGLDPTTVVLLDGTGAPVKSLDVPGEGTWSVDPVTGEITFTPVAGFTGDPTPVSYTAAAPDGTLADPAPITLTFAGADDVQLIGAAGQPATATPALEAGLDPTTVALIDPATGQRVTTLPVAGEGTWTVDPVTGEITFTPDAGFTGDPTPVSYTVADAQGVFTNPAELSVTYATVSDTSAVGAEGQPVTFPAVLEPGLDPTTVQLVDAAGNRVPSITVPGEGTWTVSPISGALTFTPVAGFTGDPAPVQYTAANAAGDFADPATATVTYAGVSPVTPVAAEGQPVTVTPVLEAGLDPASVVLLDPAGNPVKNLSVPGEGTWAVDPLTGEITFTPVAGFTGDPAPVSYTAAAPDGTLATPAPITISYAAVGDATVVAAEGGPATFAPALEPGLDPTTVVLLDTTGAPVKSLDVPGQGTWTVDPATGEITFTPVAGFTDDPTPVQFTAATADGTLADPATATLTYASVGDTTVAAAEGQPATFTPALEPGLDPTTVVLLDADGNPVKSVDVPDEGTWSVDPATGEITFTPVPGFAGTVTPVQFTAADADGNLANPATATLTFAGVSPVDTVVAKDKPATITPALDAGLDPATVVLLDPATGEPTKTLTVPGEGVWTVAPDGTITFVPEDGFAGDTTPVQYTAADATGTLANPADIALTFAGINPTTVVAAEGQPVTFTPNLDPGLDPATVALIDPATGARVSELVVPGEGTWLVGPDGVITFTPEEGFVGETTPVQFTAATPDGDFAEPASASVKFSGVTIPPVTGTQGEPVVVRPVLGEGLDPSSVVLLDANGNPTKQLVVPGEGTWTVNPDGTVTFMPVEGFEGDPTPVQVTAALGDGTFADPTTITLNFPDVRDMSPTVAAGQPFTITPDIDEDTVATSVVLLDAAGNPTKTLVVDGEGTWTVNPDGTITFTPVAGFTGSPSAVQFTAADAAGNLANPATISATSAGLGAVTTAAAPGETAVITPVLDAGLDPATLSLINPVTGERVKTLSVPGEGTWTVNPDGTITFDPQDGFEGDPTPVQFTAATPDGTFASPATITLNYPQVFATEAVGAPGGTVTITPSFDEDIDRSTVVILDANGNPVKQLAVDGEGTWTVNPDGTITFVPEDGFTGSPTPIRFRASDAAGNRATPQQLELTTATVGPVTALGAPGQPVMVQPALGAGMDPSTVVLIDPATGNRVTRLDVPGEGVWTVDPTTGAITFTPLPGFMGDPTPVKYTASDAAGNVATPQEIAVNYAQVPTLSGSGGQGEPVTITPTLGDGFDASSIWLIDPVTGERVKTVIVPGEGVWTVDPTTGAITFTPEQGFQGDQVEIQYTAVDADGNVADPVTITVKFPDVGDVKATAEPGTTVVIPLDLGANIDPSTVTLIDENGNNVSEIVVPGEGTWTIDPQAGTIVFTPEPGFEGTATPVRYSAQDANGQWAEPAQVSLTYIAEGQVEQPTPTPEVPAPPAPPVGGGLALTGGTLPLVAGGLGLLALLTGAALLLVRRKRHSAER